MENERVKALFSATNKTTNMMDTGKTIRSRDMEVRNGLRLRINQTQCRIKGIFMKADMRIRERSNSKMALNTQATL